MHPRQFIPTLAQASLKQHEKQPSAVIAWACDRQHTRARELFDEPKRTKSSLAPRGT
jgi:hypothetical protein